jgi:hypothetical protein
VSKKDYMKAASLRGCSPMSARDTLPASDYFDKLDVKAQIRAATTGPLEERPSTER